MKTNETAEKGLEVIILWAMISGLLAGILESFEKAFFAPSPLDKTSLVLSMLLGAGVVYWLRFTKPQNRGRIEKS